MLVVNWLSAKKVEYKIMSEVIAACFIFEHFLKDKTITCNMTLKFIIIN